MGTSLWSLDDRERHIQRQRFLANIGEQDEPTDFHDRARTQLTTRLDGWYGDFTPIPSQYLKSKFPTVEFSAVRVFADPTELMIIRALSMTYPAAQFGVSPGGDVFTARGDGWTIRGPRIYVARLSWLLDEAADLFNHLRGNRGGRFFERDGKFFTADGKATFMHVVPTEGEIDYLDQTSLHQHPQRARSATARPHREARIRSGTPETLEAHRRRCSLHDAELTNAGTCDSCAELLARPRERKSSSKPWWRFW